MRKKFLSLLVLLAAVATGAEAQTETLLTTITATGVEQASYSTANVATVSFSYTAEGSSAYLANWGWWGYGWSATVNAAEGYTITKCVFYDDANRTATDSEAPFVVETTEEDKTPKVNGTPIEEYTSKGIKKIDVYGYETPATTTITWDYGFCSGVTARRDEGEYLAWDNSKDGITVTYGGSDDYDGIEGGYIELYGSSESKMIFSSTVGDISKIEVYYISNEGSVPADWTLDATNSKFVWEGTPAASVDMKKGDAQFISFGVDHIVFTVESQGGTTAVENVQTNHVQATKFFRDGQLLIEKNGKFYNAQGVEVE